MTKEDKPSRVGPICSIIKCYEILSRTLVNITISNPFLTLCSSCKIIYLTSSTTLAVRQAPIMQYTLLVVALMASLSIAAPVSSSLHVRSPQIASAASSISGEMSSAADATSAMMEEQEQMSAISGEEMEAQISASIGKRQDAPTIAVAAEASAAEDGATAEEASTEAAAEQEQMNASATASAAASKDKLEAEIFAASIAGKR
jgi:hypothetical protein